jgi:hypothetical protein
MSQSPLDVKLIPKYDFYKRNEIVGYLSKGTEKKDILQRIKDHLARRADYFRGWSILVRIDVKKHTDNHGVDVKATISGHPGGEATDIPLSVASLYVDSYEKNRYIIFLSDLISKYRPLKGAGTLALFIVYAVAKHVIFKSASENSEPIVIMKLLDASKTPHRPTSYYEFLNMQDRKTLHQRNDLDVEKWVQNITSPRNEIVDLQSLLHGILPETDFEIQYHSLST